jgi:hypothetical protein
MDVGKLENTIGWRLADTWEFSCDWCQHQDAGRHYCNLHSIVIKNMDIKRCDDFQVIS